MMMPNSKLKEAVIYFTKIDEMEIKLQPGF
jgi:hypothetical protein